MLTLPERQARDEMQRFGATHVLVVFGGRVGYANDDLAKVTWMVRAAKESGLTDASGKILDERQFFAAAGEFRVDGGATPMLRSSLLYRLSYYRFAELFTEPGAF